MPSWSSSICRLVAATVLGCCVVAMGQAAAVQDPATRDNKDTPAGVSIPDSPGAVEKLGKAHEKELQQQWKTAAEFYQEVLTKYPARVVSLKIDKQAGTFQYSGVAPIIQERIARWPEDGLTVYRNLYGRTASDLLASARRSDIGTLRVVFWDYFVTDAGKTAGIRLIDNYMETGDFPAAAWIGDRLLTLHPSLGGDWGMILYRTALAWHWSGDDTRASALLDQLRQKNPNEAGSIAGKDTLLVDAMTAAIKATAPAPTTRPADADTWPRFNGIDGRGDVSTSLAKPGASLTTVPIAPPEFPGVIGAQRTALEQNDKLAVGNFQALGVMPVVDGGTLFFQDGRCVYAVNGDTGIALPGWLNTYTGEQGGHYRLNVSGRARNEQLTVAVTPSVVLAVMGQPDHPSVPGMPNGAGGMAGFGGPAPAASTVKLVCLDRNSGRELWTRTPAELPETVAALRVTEYVGTALVIPAGLAGHAGEAYSSNGSAPADSVLIIARGGKEQQFDDCYLVCLSLKTGQYQWSTYLGSATRGMDTEGGATQDASQMALAEGHVFVMTNLGSVAALDPADGRLIWLNSYERDNVENLTGMVWRGRGRRFNGDINNGVTETKAWARNPVFVSNGHVFVMPTDAKKLFVYNAGSGAEETRIIASDYDNANVLLGARQDVQRGVRYETVILSSQTGLYIVDWKKYNHESPAAALRCANASLTGPADVRDPNTVCGRGFVTADSIFLPSRDRLYRVKWPGGRIASVYPAQGTFTGGQGPGNVLVTALNVVIAGSTQLDVYTDLKMVQARYEQEMALAPNDAEPRVRFAEVLYAGGQTTEALAQVDAAINLLGGLSAMRSGNDRSMIFTTVLDFAHRAQSDADKDAERKAERLVFADQLFDRAGAAADSPHEKAIYRLARARADHENLNYANEVKLCQEILSDPALRPVVIAENITAADAAEAAIGVVIEVDRSVYRPIESLAGDARDKAVAANNPEQLLAVGLAYPNSHAAADARQAAVDRFEASHEPARAIDILRQIYASTTDPSVKAQRLQEIANDFLAMHEIGPAVDRLARAAKISPDPVMTARLDLPDGTTLQGVSYVRAVDALRQIQSDEASAKLPDFKLGAGPGATQLASPFLGTVQTIEGVIAVAHPLRDYNRYDQILTWSAAGLAVYPVGQTHPLSTIADVKDVPQGAAWIRDKWIVWTNTDLFEISGNGKLDWTVSLTRLPTLMVSTAGEAVVDDPEVQNDGSSNINFRLGQNGRVVNWPAQFAVRQGRMQPVMVPPGALVPPVPEGGALEQVVAVQPAGGQLVVCTSIGRVLAINNNNGQILWQTRTSDRAADQLLANAHFTIVRLDDAGGSQVVVYDTRNGRVIGRRRFSAENTPGQLVNVALSEEATLAFTLYNRVLVKDLYDPWKTPPTELAAHVNQDNAPLVGLSQPDQFLIGGGRLIVLYDNGRYLRGFDLTGSTEPTRPLNTFSTSPAVWLQMVGPRVFVVRITGMKQYNLADPGDHDPDPFSPDTIPHIRTMLLGKDHAVLLDERNDRGAAGSTNVRILAYTRAKVPGKTIEDGRLVFDPAVPSPSGITDWLAADGGLYYLTKDGNLHFLRGGRT